MDSCLSDTPVSHLPAIHGRTAEDSQFQFIVFDSKSRKHDRTHRRLIQSYAVANGLRKKLQVQQQAGQNFRAFLPSSISKKNPTRKPRVRRPTSQRCDHTQCTRLQGPLEILMKEAPRLQETLIKWKIVGLLDSAISVLDELVLNNLHIVIRQCQNDNVLLSAVMFSFLSHLDGNHQYVGCHNYALANLRRRMGQGADAASDSTMAAILLLAGKEARLGSPQKVQIHMGAVRELLKVCWMNGISLSDDIKRAIFWQDLNCSVLAGSTRVVDHTTFPELDWQRDAHSLVNFAIPEGFSGISHLVQDEFLKVLQDVNALQRIRDSTFFSPEEEISMTQIDNHQASIQSRIVSLRSFSSVHSCCYLAVYLCSTMLRCRRWRTSTVPSQLSLQLLRELEKSNTSPVWEAHLELLTWMLHLGGSFAPLGPLRSRYTQLSMSHWARWSRSEGHFPSWDYLVNILRKFIWSDNAFASQARGFWKEVYR